jgi:ligand-binding sensor domain-containing protein
LSKVFTQTINFKNYTTESGLPQSQILALFQDKDNLIWIGTNSGGAASFDGQKFTIFDESVGLSQNTIKSITRFKEHIVFATNNGLDLLKDNTFLHYGVKNGLKSEIIYKVLPLKDSLLIATQKGVFTLFNNKILEFPH